MTTRSCCLQAAAMVAIAIACADGPGRAAAAAAPSRPDILILMADNWAWPHAGCLGDPVVRTPHIDRLAAGGMRFDHAFCLAPSCAAARAAFLTGRPVHALGPAANLHSRFPSHLVTFPELLSAAGYAVGHAGKGWGPGDWQHSGRTSDPSGPRFESFRQFLATVPADASFCFWFSSKLPHLHWRDGGDLRAALRPQDVRVPAYLPDLPVVRDDILDYYGEVMAFDREVGDAAGGRPAERTTGRSMLPLWTGVGEWQGRDAVFLERERHANVRRGNRGYPVRAIRTREHLYVRNFEPDLWPAGDPETWFSVGPFGDCDNTATKGLIIDRRDDPTIQPFFNLNFAKRPAEELYDLRTDPAQTRTIASDATHAGVKKALADRLAAWMRETGDPRADDPRATAWDEAAFLGSPARLPAP